MPEYRYIRPDGSEEHCESVQKFAQAVRTGAIQGDTLVYTEREHRWCPAYQLDIYELAHADAMDRPEAPHGSSNREAAAEKPGELTWRVLGAPELEGRALTWSDLLARVERGELDQNVRVMRNDMVLPIPLGDVLDRAGVRKGSQSSARTDEARSPRESPAEAREGVGAARADPPPASARSSARNHAPEWGPFAPILPRATRRAYAFWIGLGAIGAAFVDVTGLSAVMVGLLALLLIVGGIASLIAGVGRLHDMGKSGWWLLLSLIPLINFGLGLYLLFGEPERGPNVYGPNPRRAAR